MGRKIIEWALFAAVAACTVLLVRWLVPRAAIFISRATAKHTPARIDSTLRHKLRLAENKLEADHPAAATGEAYGRPCLVIPAPLGVGTLPGHQSQSAIQNCLELVPGGPPVNAVEVDLQTGALLLVQTDLYMPGDPPIAFTRVVEPFLQWNRRFKVFLQDEYETFPFGDRFPYTYMKVQLADRSQVPFRRISKGTGYADAVYESETRGSIFYNALEGWNGDGWDLDLDDGVTLVFPEAYYSRRPQQEALVGLFERAGDDLTLNRDRSGNLQSVRSSDGRWMRLRYQGPLIVALEDNAGEKASFSYGKGNLLASSTNTKGETLSYSYNEKGKLVEVHNTATNKSVLKARYGASGAVSSVRVPGAGIFDISYRINSASSHAEVDINERGVGRWSVLLRNCSASGCAYDVVKR